MLISQSRPAEKKRALIFCCDANVKDYVRFVIHRLSTLETERTYEFCVCTLEDGLEIEHPKLPPVRVCKISPDAFSGLPADARIPISAYIKLALPAIFEHEYTQIVYMDPDFYPRHGCLNDLFDSLIPGRAVSAVLDHIQWTREIQPKRLQSWKNLGIVDSKYCNTGLLAYDVAAFVEQGIFEGIMEFTKSNYEYFMFHDQSALNGYLKGDWQPLSLRWNWPMFKTPTYFVDEYDPIFLHFVAQTKPYVNDPVKHVVDYIEPYETFFRDILERENTTIAYPDLTEKSSLFARLRTQLRWRSILSNFNKINPFYYTPLRGFLTRHIGQKNISDIEKAIDQGVRLWPYEDRQKGILEKH